MKTIKTLCFVSAFGFAMPAFAEWVEIHQDNESTSYIDSNVKRNGDKVIFWQLTDYKVVQNVLDVTYRSVKTKHEFDCFNELNKMLYVVTYSEKMGGGKSLGSHQYNKGWEPIAPHTVGSDKMNIVCNFKKTNLK